MNEQLPTYEQTDDALITLSAYGNAGQSHGLLCALMSAHARINREAWVDSLLGGHIEPSDERARAAYSFLGGLFNVTKDYFQRDELDLPLLLPSDDMPLSDRVEALGSWCQGYLTGLHLLGLDIKNNQSPEINECLQDLIEISQVELGDPDQADAQSEVHYIELVEHVRMAVLAIWQELKIAFKETEQHQQCGSGCGHVH